MSSPNCGRPLLGVAKGNLIFPPAAKCVLEKGLSRIKGGTLFSLWRNFRAGNVFVVRKYYSGNFTRFTMYHPSCEHGVKRRCIYAKLFSPKVGRCAGNEPPFIQKGCILLARGLSCIPPTIQSGCVPFGLAHHLVSWLQKSRTSAVN